MKRLESITAFLGSKTLTWWIAGLSIVYYLSIAVWSEEAFASLVGSLGSRNIFRAVYVLLLMNVLLRSAGALKAAWGSPGRFIVRSLFYGGLFLFLFSFFMSLNMRETVQVLVGQGDRVEIPWETGFYRVERIDSALKKHALKTRESLIFDSEPALVLSAANGASYTIGAFPPRRVRSAYIHILNFGIGPYIELRDRGAVVSEGYMPLRLTPFGKTDAFDIPPYPYRFYLNILPNRIVKKGTETGREYDLEKPLYGVSIEKGETDRTLSFDRALSVSFLPPSDWVLLEIVYDPFLPGLAAGLILLPLGAICLLLSFIGDNRTERGHTPFP